MKKTHHQKEISRSLNYQFKNNRLLEEALTHSSASKSSKSNNERLEFLGDRVLGLVIADELLRLNPCLLYTSPSPRDKRQSRMPSSA